ncbi:MAG TPA: transposase [Terriglobia bacterium]|nr:transposase [Terriglobia bacterium]
MAAHLSPDRVCSEHQRLHHFVADAPWSDQAVLDSVRGYALERVSRRAGSPEALLIDDTGHPKKGKLESVKQHGRSTTTILAGQRGSCRCIRSYLTLLLRSCRCVIVEVDAHRYCATLPSSGNWPLNGLAGLSSCN